MANIEKKALAQWQIEDADRLKTLFKERSEMTQTEFGAEFKIGSQGMVWQYLNARRPLNLNAAMAFAQGLSVPIESFSPVLAAEAIKAASMTGRINEGTEVTYDAEGSLTPSKTSDAFEVPRFDARASMGDGFPVPEFDHIVERIQITRSWIQETLPSITNPKNLALLPAFGDSMEGTFNDGDLLWVDRGVKEVKIDAVYVLALRDELYIKRLQRRPDGSILMISDNKKYEPYLIQNGEREKFRVLGRVVYAWCGKKI